MNFIREKYIFSTVGARKKDSGRIFRARRKRRGKKENGRMAKRTRDLTN